MPALPSFITAGFKTKASSSSGKTPFYRRAEPTPPPPAPPPPAPEYLKADVIDINNNDSSRYSLDFDGGKPNDEFEKAIFDDAPRLKQPNTVSPQVKLELSPVALADWFGPNFLDAFPEANPQGSIAGGSGLRDGTSAFIANGSSKVLNGKEGLPPHLEDGRDDTSSSVSSSKDLIANLQEMDPSHFGKMPGYDNFKRLDPGSVVPPKSLTALEAPTSYKPARPMSTAEELLSSAVSGSTLARALMSNSFVLPSDSRASRHFRAAGGLARSDSYTLPRSERSFGGAHSDESFAISPDAPPIPSGAEALYRPPQIARTHTDGKNKNEEALTRQTSGNSINVKALPKTPSVTSTRPSSTLLSPGVEFDVTAIVPPATPNSEARRSPSIPRSPLPLPPTPKLAYLSSDEGGSSKHSSKQGSIPEEYRQHFPMDSQLNSPDLNQLSPTVSSEGMQSARDLEGVLGYYSLPDTPDLAPALAYQPAFSPISEESSSQLSPPSPYRTTDRRESTRAPFGGRSPSGNGRVVRQDSLTLPRRPSDRSYPRTAPSLLSVAENGNAATPRASSPNTSSSQGHSSPHEMLAPPPVSAIFPRRLGGGNTPSPIKVIRDSKDANAYKITVSPHLLENQTPTDEDGNVTQEFPETPNMFSPMLTGDSGSGSMMPILTTEGTDVDAMASGPRSATLPRGGSQSVAQALFLNRAGTTIGHFRQANHSAVRPKDIGRSRSPSTSNSTSNLRLVDVAGNAEHVTASPSPAEDSVNVSDSNSTAVRTVTDEPESIQPQGVQNDAVDSNRMSLASVRYSRASSLAASVSQESDTSASMYSPSVSSKSSKGQRILPHVPPPLPSSPAAPFMATSPAVSCVSLPTQVSIPPPNTPTNIPVPLHIPTPPPQQPQPQPQHVAETPVLLPPAAPRYIPPPPTMPPPSPSPSQKTRSSARGRAPPALTITNVASSSGNTVALNGSETSDTSPESSQPTQTIMVVPSTTIHAPTAASEQEQSITYKAGFIGRDSDLFRGTSLGSPPPYYSIIREAIHDDQTPTTGFAGSTTFSFPATATASMAPAPSPPTSDWTNTPHAEIKPPATLGRHNSIVSQRSRMRPPLPAGPRRPSQGMLAGFPSHQLRDRSGSVSSVGSTSLLVQATREREAAAAAAVPLASPKFQTPSPKWRGYTMEAAKWTFTSAQLQAIVSRAIRQSAEASSIRLLRLEILDNDIPEEIRRLEAQRTELKNRYKTWARRRGALIDGLAIYMTAGDEEAPAYAARMVDDLRDVSMMLDNFAEELHSVDGQLAQLDGLVQIHTGSALAMALRKLNTSFLKQVADNQVLRNQIQSLEAERDEAWQQAAEVATELDKMESQASSRRSSRISAVRKSSIRVSKAGLRTPSQRLSQLSSHGGGIHFFNTLPKSPMVRPQRIPPVPAIPRHRPPELLTDIMNRTSATSPGYTPTSETEALIEAQEELYAMLGITNPEKPRRSRSISMMSGGSSAAPSSSHHAFFHAIRPPDTPALSLHRRSSLPGDSTLAETYNAMAADRKAVLATIDMLSSTD